MEKLWKSCGKAVEKLWEKAIAAAIALCSIDVSVSKLRTSLRVSVFCLTYADFCFTNRRRTYIVKITAPFRRPGGPKMPRWAQMIARFAKYGDRGVGDTLERVIATYGLHRFSQLASAAGYECGCAERRDSLNRQYPYQSGNGSAVQRY